MTVLLEMADILRAPDALDRSSGLEQLERASSIAAVCAQMQGDGSGHCEDCGLMIPHARRKAAPWAVCCIDCQSLREGRRHG